MATASCTRTSSGARGWFLDLFFGGLAALFLVAASGHIAAAGGEHALDAFGYVVLLAGAAVVGLCRRWPRSALALATVVLSAYIAGRYPGGPIYVVGWVALFCLSWATDRRTALIGGAGLCFALSVTSLLVAGDFGFLSLVFVGWAGAAIFLGDALRNRRSYLRGLEERNRSLERTREEEGRRRVAEERLRIARDLHDSVAHAMAVINVQAGAAAHVVDRHPEATRPALLAIQDASHDVLEELAAMVRVLRAEDAVELVPTPGVEQVPDLVDAAAAANLPVHLVVDGALDDVSAPVGTAAYRIVQESLTNVMRHSPGATTHVAVLRGADRNLRVEVRDDGRAVDLVGGGARDATPGAGMGIRGMQERVAATGGFLTVGPDARGGFAVVATWPAP